jgi:hypothetical protein
MAPSQKSFAQYESLSTDAPKSIAWASTGGDGSGKSHFALTAPGPIFVCAFDPYGMNRVSKDVKIGKEIRIARYPFNAHAFAGDKSKTQKAAMELWQQFRADFDEALTHSRTILWDREDLMYELQRFANFGAQSDAPKEYGPLYMEYGWLVQKSQAHGVNLGILRGIRDKWVSKFDPAKGKMVAHNTGEKQPDGMSKIPDHVDVTLAHRWDLVQKQFVVKIDKFTNMNEKDQEYPNLTFSDMAQLAYPDTDESDWS